MCTQKELEAAEKRVKELKDDLAAVQFTPHSKHGKLLMAKCRTLQEENTEIGREASEGKVSQNNVTCDPIEPQAAYSRIVTFSNGFRLYSCYWSSFVTWHVFLMISWW